MIRSRFVMIVGMILMLAITSQPAWASQEFVISCEGTRCGGGGTYEYQYTLKNISGASVTLNKFFVGTMDLNASNYVFENPSGFTALIIPNDGDTCNVIYTTEVETPHGGSLPLGEDASTGVIYWNGSALIANQGTITFKFIHPSEPWDYEWFAFSSAGWTIAQGLDPVAGPTGTYTYGWIHAPSTAPSEGKCSIPKEQNEKWIPPKSGTGCSANVVAQSFQPQEDFLLCAVSAVLESGSASPTSATLYVQSDPSSSPAIIYTQGTNPLISGEGWYHFDVPDVALADGIVYYIRVNGNVSWKHIDTNPYPNGMAYQNMTPWSSRDHYFVTWAYCYASVEMSLMDAERRDGYIEIRWATETEIDNIGFNIHRSLSDDNPSARINGELIPASGDEFQGASYSFVDRDVVDGFAYYYWIESVDVNGNGTMHGPILAGADESTVPAAFALEQNYPNPFNPFTEIKYNLPMDCRVKLDIYNVLGEKVVTLVDEHQRAGGKIVKWDGRDARGMEVASGTYFCKLRGGNLIEVKKMVLLR